MSRLLEYFNINSKSIDLDGIFNYYLTSYIELLVKNNNYKREKIEFLFKYELIWIKKNEMSNVFCLYKIK